MDKTIRKYMDFDEMKADEYRYWQSRPAHERVAAVSELTEEGYKLKGFKPDAFRLQRTLVHFERAPWRPPPASITEGQGQAVLPKHPRRPPS
jgi:hypothetical protein